MKPVSVPLWGTRLWASPGASVCLYLSVLCPRLLPVSLAEKGGEMGTLRSGDGGGSGWLSIPAGPGGRHPCPDVLQSPCGMCASRHRLRAFCPGKGGGGGGCRELETGRKRWELSSELNSGARPFPSCMNSTHSYGHEEMYRLFAFVRA